MLLLVLDSIFAGLYGRLVGMAQTLIPEKSELNMTFSGLTAAVVHLQKTKNVGSIQKDSYLLQPESRKS